MIQSLKLFFRITRKLIMPLMILSLVITNGMTLLNASFHDLLYRSLSNFVPQSWTMKSPSTRDQARIKQQNILKDRTQIIAKRVRKRTVRNISVNISSLAAEAVPLAGIAAILATTTMDFNDACNDMKDMDELASMFSLEGNNESGKVCGMQLPSLDELKWRLGFD